MTKNRVLIVEDDLALADVLHYNLEQAGYEASVANDGMDGLHRALQNPPDVVVLDLMLPSMDGLEVCRKIRSAPDTAEVLVLMLTAKEEEVDQVSGFAVGADDYVTKPFSVKVLLQRIKALLRRRDAQLASPGDVIVSQGVKVDRRRHQATAGDEIVELTRSEFNLLDALVRQPGRAFSRAELIDAALGEETLVLERTIDVHIGSVRRKLGDYGKLIETVRGVGYRFRDPRQ